MTTAKEQLMWRLATGALHVHLGTREGGSPRLRVVMKNRKGLCGTDMCYRLPLPLPSEGAARIYSEDGTTGVATGANLPASEEARSE